MTNNNDSKWIQNRIAKLTEHLTKRSDAPLPPNRLPTSHKEKWNGWGYEDTYLFLNDNKQVEIAGNRYTDFFPFFAHSNSSHRVLPHLREWAEKTIGLNTELLSKANPNPPVILSPDTDSITKKALIESFINDINGSYNQMSMNNMDLIRHSHGHTCTEIFNLRHGKNIKRTPDIIVWPGSHVHVEVIMTSAIKHNICLMPYGGGTNVTNALECDSTERRVIACLNMQQMNSIKFIDKENMLISVEAGINGKELNDKLRLHNITLGHEPDSWEFSTMGGWISTRASGMKKNVYGNIEDVLLNVTMVTPTGILKKHCNVPRVSMGPDIQQLILGSEGMFGIITEAVVRVVPLPEVVEYDSVIFPDFETGIQAVREITREKCLPASLRLMDNIQFQFGQALKPASETPMRSAVINMAKKAFVTKIKGYDVSTMCAATILFEGKRDQIEIQKKDIFRIIGKYGGMRAGAENGHRGYSLTYIIAYLRDFAFDYFFMSESFETCVPWSNAQQFCEEVTKAIVEVSFRNGVQKRPLVCCRVTQMYESGCCIYVYFGLNYYGLSSPLEIFHQVEQAAVQTMLANHASLSHHHGVGQHRREYLPQSIGSTALPILKQIKHNVDPDNLMACRNLITP